MATTLKEYVLDRLRSAAKRYADDLGASSPETLVLKPGGSARNAFDYSYEVVVVNRRVAKRLCGEDPGPFANDGWIVAPAEFCDRATALSEFRTSANAVIAAIEAENEAQLDRIIPIPSGETSPLDLASLSIGHWTYHDGQINYAQAIAGDEQVHWE